MGILRIQMPGMPGGRGGFLFLGAVGHIDLVLRFGDPPGDGPEEQDAAGHEIPQPERQADDPENQSQPRPAGQIDADGKYPTAPSPSS